MTKINRIDLDAAYAALHGAGNAQGQARDVCPNTGKPCFCIECGPAACRIRGEADSTRFPVHDDDHHPVNRRHLRVALAALDMALRTKHHGECT